MYAHDAQPEMLCAPAAQLEAVELGGTTPSKRTLRANFTMPAAAAVSGFIQWFELQLGPDVVLSTEPGRPRTHWRQIFFPFAETVAAKEGDVWSLELRVDTRLSAPLSVSMSAELGRGRGTVFAYDSVSP
jgi:protein arginine N-methyltransferase 1